MTDFIRDLARAVALNAALWFMEAKNNGVGAMEKRRDRIGGAQKRNRVKAMRGGKVWAPRPWTTISADTGVGNPAKATPEKGKAFTEAVVAYLADFLTEFAAAARAV
jgi:creatinine amidohydrolase/Fe(II)-dependent formamide hydrolase-like protein